MSDNQDIINAIGGAGYQAPQTTLGTGVDNMSSGVSDQAPMFGQGGALQNNMNYQNTTNQLFGMQQPFSPYGPSQYSPQVAHGIGKDMWGSRMQLTNEDIMRNLGLTGA